MTTSQQSNIFTQRLPNGQPLVHIATTGHVGWCGLAVNAGSRDDGDGTHGLAHFVEHTLFKGTTHRSAWHILNRMEVVGGELNAYTTKEDTTLYSVFPAPYLARAIELLADLVTCSTFPQGELELEREVVLEEAASYRDSPSEAVWDDFEDMLWQGSALGHNILGNHDGINACTSQVCASYLKSQWVPGNMAFFSVGPAKPERVFALAERHLAHMHHSLQRAPRTTPPVTAPESRMIEIGTHQAHLVVGARVPGVGSEQRHALALLNNILGGPGMNSLLNVNLRERRGLVYTVESSLSTFTDCGMLQIYLGCDPSKVKRALRLVHSTIDSLAQRPLAERRLNALKLQYAGQLQVAASTLEFTAMRAGKSLLLWGDVQPVDRGIERMMAVTPAQLQEAAQLLAPDLCSTLTLL